MPVEEEGNVPADGRKRAKVKRHCARFWWIHAIIFIVVVLVVVLPVYVSDTNERCTEDVLTALQGLRRLSEHSSVYDQQVDTTGHVTVSAQPGAGPL